MTLDSVFRQFESDYLQTIGDVNRPDVPAILGDPDGNLYANSAETKVYIRGFGVDPDSFTTMSASGIPKNKLIPNQPVLIKLTSSGQYRFVALDVQADEIFTRGASENPTQDPVYLNQIRYGTVHPTGNLSVLVVGAFYDDLYVGDLQSDLFDGTATDTSTVAISAPTTNNRQKAVLIQVDATNGTLEYKQGSEYNAGIRKTEAYSLTDGSGNNLLPRPDVGRYRAGYVFLKTGIPAITYGDIWQAPEIITSSGGSGGEWQVIADTDKTLAANTQIVLSEFSVSGGVTITIESGAIMRIIG